MKRLKLFQRLMIAVLLTLLLALAGCGGSGSDGAAGPAGTAGAAGAAGATGPAGPVSLNPMAYSTFAAAQVSAKDGIANATTGPHGEAFINATAVTPATVTFTAQNIVAGANTSTVTFTLTNTATGVAITTMADGDASFIISSLKPRDAVLTPDGKNYKQWINYINAASTTVPVTNYPGRERSGLTATTGRLVHNGAGSYTYTFLQDMSAATTYGVGGAAITFDRSRTHRIGVSLRTNFIGDYTYDFVPDGTAGSGSRDLIVADNTCNKCHKSIPGHYNGVKVCVMCHNPSNAMPNFVGTVNTMEASVFFHKIHAGRELASAPGADGIWFDDPATTVDESADNGTWAFGRSATYLTESYRSAAFPAVLDNCVVCHTGAGADVDNWKTVPSRAACGSCHDNIVWATGANHAGGLATSDDNCVVCHPSTGTGFGLSVTTAHDFAAKNIHNIPEFGVTLTTSTPANGTHFVAGESPVITVVLTKAGVAINHTTVVEQTATAEGCITTTDLATCDNAADGFFRAANLIVTGPRGKRIPVLTTAARAKINSATTGTWDLSAGALSLRVVVDAGNFIVEPDEVGEDQLMSGDFTVKLPAAGAALNALFANPAAATAAEIAAWLNGASATFVYNERTWLFSERAVASVGDGLGSGAGKLSLRTRARGSYNPSIQIPERVSATSADELNALLFTDNAVKVSGYSNQIRQRTSAANDDLKAVRTAANIKYTLDPVDDLVAGTYVVNVEIGDRGNPSGNPISNVNPLLNTYRTPSVAVATFQVKQAAVEAPIADGCTNCHWSTNTVGAGVGFVLDPVRHNKPFNAQAVDQCGACHRYQSGETVATRTWTTGGGQKPLSKRVHAVHMGAQLVNAALTVDHEESVAGRNWQITYPMNILNCESCHSAATSGTWKTKPNRLACMGCHDSSAAIAHMKAQVSDPTPTAPWSGDEMESCAACH